MIRLSGKVKKRKKKLSKEQYGTSHTVSLAEAEHIFDEGAERLIIGSGQQGNVKLSQMKPKATSRRRAARSNRTQRQRPSRFGTRPRAKPLGCSM